MSKWGGLLGVGVAHEVRRGVHEALLAALLQRSVPVREAAEEVLRPVLQVQARAQACVQALLDLAIQDLECLFKARDLLLGDRKLAKELGRLLEKLEGP